MYPTVGSVYPAVVSRPEEGGSLEMTGIFRTGRGRAGRLRRRVTGKKETTLRHAAGRGYTTRVVHHLARSIRGETTPPWVHQHPARHWAGYAADLRPCTVTMPWALILKRSWVAVPGLFLLGYFCLVPTVLIPLASRLVLGADLKDRMLLGQPRLLQLRDVT